MYAFKFVSVSATFLLALVQGVVSQDAEPVPQGGLCETIAGPRTCKFFAHFFYVVALTVFYKGAEGLKCCILGPDNGMCNHRWLQTLHVFAHFFYVVTLTVVYTGVPGLKCCVLGPDNGVAIPTADISTPSRFFVLLTHGTPHCSSPKRKNNIDGLDPANVINTTRERIASCLPVGIREETDHENDSMRIAKALSSYRGITGNADGTFKQSMLDLPNFIDRTGRSRFGDSIIQGLVVTHASVDKKADEPLKTGKDMLNGGGSVHGGCSAYLIDMCSTLVLMACGQYVHVSQSLNIVYHSPAALRTMTARTEIWNATKHRLVASGVHIKMAPSPSSKL
ncbi:hypothetical protein B0H14DRAFT_2563188 [Mycena olivaceomarginata]|nr:hypothetical protein B0H14DRAFT_2563188 [Mycena olivaceomarginata]